jgi:PAS domain S-box-containing protein
MPNIGLTHGREAVTRKGALIALMAFVLAAAVLTGAVAGHYLSRGDRLGSLLSLALLPGIPLLAYLLYKRTIFPYYRSLEDANLELHLKQEELLDTKDDLFIKFLGIYDVNYAANSPRLFNDRLRDVADITARVMEADLCLLFLYDRKNDDLMLSAANDGQRKADGSVRVPLGEGIEGWVGRRLEPVLLKELQGDARFRDRPGLGLSDYTAVYCLPLYVYSSGALMGVIELLYRKAKNVTDEEINFFTTLSGIISTTIQNEQLQAELRKMNVELEQWIAEKTEEFRASEERYRTLVENACESIFVLADNGDIVFANEQAARLTGHEKYDLIHKNLIELFVDPPTMQGLLTEVREGRQSLRHGALTRADGTVVPVDVSAVELALMGKKFIQSVVRDMSHHARLEKLLEEKEREIAALRAQAGR